MKTAPRSVVPLALLLAPLALGGCGGSSSSSCSFGSSVRFTSVSKATGASPLCPDLTVDQLNAGLHADGGTGGCSPTVNNNACTISINCTEGGLTISGALAGSGSSVSGNVTVAISAGGTQVFCTYALGLTAS